MDIIKSTVNRSEELDLMTVQDYYITEANKIIIKTKRRQNHNRC